MLANEVIGIIRRRLMTEDDMTTKPTARNTRKKSVPPGASAAGEEVSAQRLPSARSAPIRRAILEAAVGLFSERGYSGTNLQDVADVLGMSRTGLYYHFSSKESLLYALAEEITSAALQVAEAAEQHAHDDPAQALRDMTARNIRWMLTHGQLFRVLDRSEGDLPEDLRERHNRSKRALLDKVVGLIDRGIRVGQFRPVDSRVAAFSLIGMANWTVWWFKPDGRISADTVVEQMTEATMRIVMRPDAYRSRSDQLQDVLRTIDEDLAQLKMLIKDNG